MATFNQKGQNVNTQYNAETINFGEINSREELLQKLNGLKLELNRAITAGIITGENAINAESSMNKVIIEAETDQPDKENLMSHLNSVSKLAVGVSGLITSIGSATTAIGSLF